MPPNIVWDVIHMAFKTCNSCCNTSYSAAEDQIWICPCCGQDLSLMKAGERPCRLTRLRPRPALALAVGETPPAELPENRGRSPLPYLSLLGKENFRR